MEWFRQLTPRERLALTTGAILAVIIVGWTLVWSPLRTGAAELDATVAERSRQVVDLRRAANLNAASAPGAATPNAPTPLVLIDQTTRPMGLSGSITRTTPDGANAISVSFRDARFDRLLDWLIDLERTHGFVVVSASFTGTNGAGLVSGQVRLERS
ncbi:MAG TPA: type II secretion system protein M [Gammaproteobacteria bacterium]|nr:type II secretion system protein M [Gammaproteobacteria bacterium]